MSKLSRVVWCGALLAAATRLGAQAAVPTTPEQVPRIEGAEAKRLLDKGQAVVVDVRNKEAWEAGHAEGAIHIPIDQLEQRLKDLPKDKVIAAYCT